MGMELWLNPGRLGAVGWSCGITMVSSSPERAIFSRLLADRSRLSFWQVGEVASEGGVGKIVLETVCQCPVGVQSERSLNRSVNGPLIEEIKTLLGYFDNYAI